jgi:DNA modification methylase
MKRKPELTFKHNRKRGRYGWLRLTPAYSLKMVQRYLPDNQISGKVFDPFCGTGTTPLYAAYQGVEAYALELNPFLVWFARIKTAAYDKSVIEELKAANECILSQVDSGQPRLVDPPPIRNIERWWGKSAVVFLRGVKGGIEEYRSQASSEEVIDLLYICFCRTLIKISNAAFNHQSVSFDDSQQLSLFDETDEYKAVFSADVQFVAHSAERNPCVIPSIIQGDARNVDEHLPSKVDLVITSPPYPNRMSYIRELRPYMYWLGYLEKAREAGELDWEAIGGTWGVATSRLSDWEQDEEKGHYPDYFKKTLRQIEDDRNKNGRKMANYVARYFEDILQHFKSLARVLNAGATVHYVVGNSTFYGVLVPVERLYKEIMELTGFSETKIEIVRKRNSKKELYEFTVSGKIPS